jgi:hypothetical protein
VATTGGTDLTSYKFRASGRWQWIWLFWTEISTTTRRIYFTKDNDANVLPFFVDGVQSEVCGSEGVFVTMFIDGDQQGLVANQFPPAYYWEGTPHASASNRSGQTRAGGRVLTLDRYGIIQTGIVGLGVAPPQHIANQYAQLDGANYDRTRNPPRQFSLIGRISSPDTVALQDLRSTLGAHLDRDIIAQQQPLVLRYQQYHPDGSERGAAALIPALYAGGLDGNINNDYAEDLAISFLQEQPGILEERTQGASLTLSSSVANANRIIRRAPNGTWSALGTGGSGNVSAMTRGLDGSIYIAGTFTNWDGNANADNIVRYDPVNNTFSALSTGCNGAVFAVAVLPDGRIVLGGAFTSAGGAANTSRIAIYNPATDTFSALGTGGSGGDVIALAVGLTGHIFAGGSFTSMGGVANTLRLARHDGSNWNAMGTGADGQVNDFTFGIGKQILYITGQFNNLNGASSQRIGSWNVRTSTFGTLSTGLNGNGITLATGLDGTIYVGGSFTLAGGVTGTAYIAAYNGVTFLSLSTGMDQDVYDITVLPDGSLVIVGVFMVAGGTTLPDSATRWNGSSFSSIGADLPGTFGASLYTAALTAPDGTLYIGYQATGTATVEGLTTVTNNGTVKSYPTLIVRGPTSGTAQLYQVFNTTTGRNLYFNFTINAGETAIFVLDPINLIARSDFQGDIPNLILPGSNEADFFLQPGANVISCFLPSATATAVLQWQPSFATLDDLIRVA